MNQNLQNTAFEQNPALEKKRRFEAKYSEIHAVPTDFEVYDLRNKMNLSQQQFAEMIGISISTVQAWEQGKRNPSRTHRIVLHAANEKVVNAVNKKP